MLVEVLVVEVLVDVLVDVEVLVEVEVVVCPIIKANNPRFGSIKCARRITKRSNIIFIYILS